MSCHLLGALGQYYFSYSDWINDTFSPNLVEFYNKDKGELDPMASMITWKDFLRLMPWEIVILVGAGYALAAGCKVDFNIQLETNCY